MKSNKTVSAFTLSEMIVVLIVASIIISMSFTVLSMVRKQVYSIQKNYQKKQEVQLLDITLLRDLNHRIPFFDEQKDILFLHNTKDTIQYLFLDSLLVREKDTFWVAINSKQLFLDGSTVKKDAIDAIALRLSSEFSNKELFFQNTKDAAFYLNK